MLASIAARCAARPALLCQHPGIAIGPDGHGGKVQQVIARQPPERRVGPARCLEQQPRIAHQQLQRPAAPRQHGHPQPVRIRELRAKDRLRQAQRQEMTGLGPGAAGIVRPPHQRIAGAKRRLLPRLVDLQPPGQRHQHQDVIVAIGDHPARAFTTHRRHGAEPCRGRVQQLETGVIAQRIVLQRRDVEMHELAPEFLAPDGQPVGLGQGRCRKPHAGRRRHIFHDKPSRAGTAREDLAKLSDHLSILHEKHRLYDVPGPAPIAAPRAGSCQRPMRPQNALSDAVVSKTSGIRRQVPGISPAAKPCGR